MAIAHLQRILKADQEFEGHHRMAELADQLSTAITREIMCEQQVSSDSPSMYDLKREMLEVAITAVANCEPENTTSVIDTCTHFWAKGHGSTDIEKVLRYLPFDRLVLIGALNMKKVQEEQATATIQIEELRTQLGRELQLCLENYLRW